MEAIITCVLPPLPKCRDPICNSSSRPAKKSSHTREDLKPTLEAKGLTAGKDFFLACLPETAETVKLTETIFRAVNIARSTNSK